MPIDIDDEGRCADPIRTAFAARNVRVAKTDDHPMTNPRTLTAGYSRLVIKEAGGRVRYGRGPVRAPANIVFSITVPIDEAIGLAVRA
jgi:hypothetical protein